MQNNWWYGYQDTSFEDGYSRLKDLIDSVVSSLKAKDNEA